MNTSPGLPSLCCHTRASSRSNTPKNQPRNNPGESQVALQDRDAGERFCCPTLSSSFRLTTRTAARCFACFLIGKSASLRCIMTGMASGSIVVFYNDFNRWNHEYQTRYWTFPEAGTSTDRSSCGQEGAAHSTAPLGRAATRLLINSSITSECNLNLLEEATYFLKLIAIFVDLAWLFWGKGKEAENQLLGSVVQKSIFLVTMRSLFWSLYVNKT